MTDGNVSLHKEKSSDVITTRINVKSMLMVNVYKSQLLRAKDISMCLIHSGCTNTTHGNEMMAEMMMEIRPCYDVLILHVNDVILLGGTFLR